MRYILILFLAVRVLAASDYVSALGGLTAGRKLLATNIFVPENYDLTGTWRMERPPRPSQTHFDNTFYGGRGWFARQNVAMLGNDNFTLKPVFHQSSFQQIATTYRGVYHHFHGGGQETVRTNYLGDSAYGLTVDVNYACSIIPIDYELTATWTVFYDYRDQHIFGFRLVMSGRTTNTLPMTHMSAFTYNWTKNWSRGQADGSQNHLFQDYQGNSILLTDGGFDQTIFDAGDLGGKEKCNMLVGDSFSSFWWQSARRRYDAFTDPQGRPYFEFYRDDPFNTVEPVFFVRSNGQTPADETGVVRGQARDRLNSLTIVRGRAGLFAQKGWLREKLDNEKEADYQAYLSANRTAVTQVALSEDGHFSFEKVPLFQRSEGGAWAAGIYSVEISGAQSENSFLPGTPVIGYARKTLINASPRGASQEEYMIGLDATTAIAAKRDEATALVGLSTNNYATIERRALDMLQKYEDGSLQLTPEREEGIQRAVWAEKAVREGTLQAQDMIEVMCGGLASAASDLLSLVLKQFDSQGSLGQKLNKEVKKETTDVLNIDKFKLKPGEDESALARISEQGLSLDLLDLMEKAGTARGAVVESLLKLKSLDAPTIANISAFVATVNKVVVNAMKSYTRVDTKSFFTTALDEAIKIVIKGFSPILYDNEVVLKIEFPMDLTVKKDFGALTNFPSFCKMNAPLLDSSLDLMNGWPEANKVRYISDITEAAKSAQALIDSGTAVKRRMIDEQALAKTLKGSSSALSFFGALGVAQAKVAGDLAKVGAIFMNTTTFVEGVVHVYATAPDEMKRGVYAAFGKAPPAGVGPRSLTTVAPAPMAAPPAGLRGELAGSFQAWTNDVFAVASALATNDLGAAIQLSTNLLSDFRAYNGLVGAVVSSGLAVKGAAVDELGFVSHLLSGQFELVCQMDSLNFQLLTIFGGAYTNRYHGELDAGFLDDRNSTLAGLQKLNAHARQLQAGLLQWLTEHQTAPLLPVVALEITSIRSDITGLATISTSPEPFTVHARVRNFGTMPLGGLSLRLSILASTNDIVPPSAMETALPSLAAFGAATGDSEAAVEWKISSIGNLRHAPVYVSVDLLQEGEIPVNIVATRATAVLPFSASVSDADDDGLPDEWERANGLNLAANDASSDPDRDGLTNLQEFQLGANPQKADSDGDGLTDWEEAGGKAGVVTDPLVADTDGDGLLDGADQSPLDASNQPRSPQTAEPVVGLELTSATLSGTNVVVNITVVNRGGGTLYWTAESGDPNLLSVSPTRPATGLAGETLTLSLPDYFDRANVGTLRTIVRVSDTAGGAPDSQDLMVTVQGDLPGSPEPTRFVSITTVAQGVRLRLSGPAGAPSRIEYSTDLRQWLPLTVVTNATGVVEFDSALPRTNPTAFLRAVLP